MFSWWLIYIEKIAVVWWEISIVFEKAANYMI